jgi:formate C-acetyltransferase
MMAELESILETKVSGDAWRDFVGGSWEKHVNVREFIQTNYQPYEGDGQFLSGATERTKKLWAKLSTLFDEERKKGVLAVSQIPSSILAHAPGYIDKASEIIVGLQTDAPLKRAIMPFGGWRGRGSSIDAIR